MKRKYIKIDLVNPNPKRMGWLSIKSAPKDGRVILGRYNGFDSYPMRWRGSWIRSDYPTWPIKPTEWKSKSLINKQ